MAYTPNPTDVTQPVESVLAKTAAAEFRALKVYIQSIVSGGGLGVATPGQVAAFPGNTPLAGWLELDGSIQVRAAQVNLWANAQALGNVVTDANWLAGFTGAFSSGDGATTFRLPDWRAEVLRGWDHGRSIDPARLLGNVQLDQIQDHMMQIHINNVAGGSSAFNATGIINSQPTANFNPNNIFAGTTMQTNGFSDRGAGAGAPRIGLETRARNVSVMWCIKT